MATPFAVTSASAQSVKRWSDMLYMQTLFKTFYSKFSATDGSMPFHIQNDLTKGPGDTLKFDLLAQMNSYGVSGNTSMIDALAGISTQEQALVFSQEEVEIEQKRIAHAWFRMSQQRSVHDLRKAAMRNLSDMWAVVLDRYIAVQLVGLTAAGLHANDTAGVAAATNYATHTTNMAAGNQGVEAHDANHILAGGAAASFQTDAHLNPARWRAETVAAPNPIQRLNVDGNEAYVMFIRPEQANSLQSLDTDWLASQQNAGVRGQENPLFQGAFGSWNGIIIHVWNYLPFGSAGTATLRYGVLCGKQAVAVGFGNAFDVLDQEKYGKDFVFAFVPRDQSDYGNIKGMSAGCVFNTRRVMFNTDATSRSYGCLQVQSLDANV
jgi:N4-gp56 family major capsid protein